MQRTPGMWAVLAASVDLIHGLLMAAWMGGLPLLFWHRWPRLTRAYGYYAVAFVLVNLASRWLLGECFLTTLARWCARSSSVPVSGEWFTVRLAQAIFRMTPSHRIVARASEMLILITALGVLRSRRLTGIKSTAVTSASAPRWRKENGRVGRALIAWVRVR